MKALNGLRDLRHTSTQPQDGYYWDEEWCLWIESDTQFRQRIRSEAVLRNAHRGERSLH
jgi:hypothetical protein